jgi:alpha-L-rhamnosidase
MTKGLIDKELDHPKNLAKVVVTAIRFEHHDEPTGIGEITPRLSWLVQTGAEGWQQTGYEIELYNPASVLLGQTGPVNSARSVLVEWPFAPLTSRQVALLRVRVRGEGTQEPFSEWSDFYPVEAGLVEVAEWLARFVTPTWQEDITRPGGAPLLRREFNLTKGIAKARLYVTALGVYEAYLNGELVGDQVMSPGWTSYSHRLRYQTFDVTPYLKEGPNCLGAMLGDGWYRGRLGWGGGMRNIYGDKLALLAQLEVEYVDGTLERVVTDEGWRAAPGPVLLSDIYDGETYDARLEKPGWANAGYADRDWAGVQPLERNLDTLTAPPGPPVRRIEVIRPVCLFSSPSGKTLVDFGQNLVGRLRLTVKGEAGRKIVLRHAEVLENGELGVRPLRFAAATDTYILKGAGVERWEPRFTFHGFRYAEVEGWPGQLSLDNLEGVVIHSDMKRTGWFECSNPLLNRLHQNVVWGMRGNFLDLPTDCPQRDERLGWTGDIQVFAPTASFLYDCAGFLTNWLADLAADQRDSGGLVPVIVPVIPTGDTIKAVPVAAWGDAAVIVPWVLYRRFGDAGILATQFESMRWWVDTVAKAAGESLLWDTGFQFGDWLDPDAPPDNPGAAKTPAAVVATAYYARSAELVGKAAGIIGKKDAEKYYLDLAGRVRAGFAKAYVSSEGTILGDSTTAYSLGLEFSLLPTERQRGYAGKRLAELVRESGYHISTGFVGTPLICDALASTGEFEAAYRLLLQTECPSWLYPVTMGATTIWERWDSMLPDGAINPGEMTSFNHYALGAVADWLHRRVGGLAPVGPGYKHLEIKPQPGGGLTWARVRHLTPYGLAECNWHIIGSLLEVEVVVPPNTTARVILPVAGWSQKEVGAGRHRWTNPYQA